MAERIPDISRVVLRHGDVAWHEEAGRVVVVRRRFRGAKAAVLKVFGVPAEQRVTLDPIGSAVWKAIDGVRPASAVLAELQRQFPTETDLPVRMGKFVGAMVSRKLVRM